MIKGFLLAFDVILIVMFLIGMIFGLKTKETGMWNCQEKCSR